MSKDEDINHIGPSLGQEEAAQSEVRRLLSAASGVVETASPESEVVSQVEITPFEACERGDHAALAGFISQVDSGEAWQRIAQCRGVVRGPCDSSREACLVVAERPCWSLL